ncbi:MAG: hypothetical protein J6T37_05890 [Bacteroidales bacterium]|nr:hypothetical protein [Bacteroidales bacterium]
MKNILLSLLITIICFSCSGQNGISKEEKAQIQEVIENHDKTLIFIWSESCGASKNMLERDIKPYLEGLEKNNVGIVIIYYGKEEAVADLKADNRLIISSNLSALFGKMNANKTMKKILKDYKKFNGFPIPILVDKDGFVLNYDAKSKYYSYWEIFQAAK